MDMALQRVPRLLRQDRRSSLAPRSTRCSAGLTLRSQPEILRHCPAILDTPVGWELVCSFMHLSQNLIRGSFQGVP